MDPKQDNSSVQVAVRIRPMVDSELSRGSQNVLEVFPSIQQVRIKGTDKAFTYNYVCNGETSQDTFYNMCIKHMISNLFKGYNMTILAYGQTGSGKTYSMGTAYAGEGDMGVIPRAVNDIFNYVNDNFAYDFTITVSFMELYQETLYDLLAQKPRDQCVVEIREDLKGIVIPGVTETVVTSAYATLELLAKGSQGRATASTNMNTQSSRSHAIFTVNICMQRKDNSNLNKTAKFHLVDLAGSERSKKTGATGVTFKEGVNINKGLLALGNVISALGDEKQQGYVGYRDSNLTRLLKDSLGGNSITLMIACVSPADYNMDETISTLRYADRARKIKNKPVVNEDPKAAEINRLNKLVQQLRLELIGQGGPIISQPELDLLKKENDSFKAKVCELTVQLSTTLNENANLYERVMLMQSANEEMNKKLLELKEEYNITINNLNHDIEKNDSLAFRDHVGKLQSVQSKLDSLNVERQKADEEIRKHEWTLSSGNLAHSDIATESELNEKQESHTKQQMALNCQLQELMKMLAMKEHLAERMVTNAHHMVDLKAMAENEEKVATMQKEKEELLQQLKTMQAQGAGSKIAEQRRKRVQELEKEIQDLHKKITEQARLIKLKEKDEQKIKLLNSEIQQMKSTKVKLIKSMKQESEKFRVWKLQREKELMKLKEQDRKRLNQIVKMETMYNRQQNVLKRKVEEAAAINKRLKDALALRKNVQEQKNSGKIERLGPWMQQEFDIYLSTIDAEATLAVLLEDRSILTMQLEQLKKLDMADPIEIQQIEEEIELRSTQIQDLQQKILDSDQEDKSKSRWDNIQTMAEAKYCLKNVFQLMGDLRKRDIGSEAKMNELQNAHAELVQKLNAQGNQIKNLEAKHQAELSDLVKDYEEKVSVLLRQFRGTHSQGSEEDVQKRFAIQQEALEKAEQELEELQSLKTRFDELEKENATLKDTLEQIKSEQVVHVFETPQKNENKKSKVNNSNYLKPPTFHLDNSFENSPNVSVEDDPTVDPDWRKTPLAKRIQEMKKLSEIPTDKDRQTVKRSSDGSCTCRGNCSKRNCGCRKMSRVCSSLCKCSQELCENQTLDKENETCEYDKTYLLPKEEEEEKDSFKRPRPLLDISKNVSVRPKTRRFFNIPPTAES